MHQIKGFSLVSLVIALGLISIAGTFAVQLQLREGKTRIGELWVDAQAREMDQVAAAVRTWTNVPANVASWSNDTRTGIPCSSLTTAGLLPTAFGRDSVPCKGPFGTVYTIVGIKNAADTTVPVGRVRTVIYLSGTHTAGLLRRAGVANNASEIQGIAMRTATKLADRKVAAGWLSGGNTTATGVGRAWTKALNLWINPAPAQASALALVGFPDLDGSVGSTGPNATNTCTGGEIVRGFCSGNQLCLNGGQGWVNPTCPVGKRKVAEFPHCKQDAVFQFNSGLGSSLILGTRTLENGETRAASDCRAYASQFSSDPADPVFAAAISECLGDRGTITETTIYVDGPHEPNFCGFRTFGFAPNPFQPGQLILSVSNNTWGYPAARDWICAVCP